MSIKEKAIQAIQELPDDADYRAVSEKLDFIAAVDQGLDQVRNQQVLTEDQVRRRLSRWLSE